MQQEFQVVLLPGVIVLGLRHLPGLCSEVINQLDCVMPGLSWILEEQSENHGDSSSREAVRLWGNS